MPRKPSEAKLARARRISVHQLQMLRMTRGLTDEELSLIPESALRRAIRRLDYPDMPRARYNFRLLQSRDESGRIEPNALARAQRQVDGTRARGLTKPRVAGVPTGRQVAPRALMALAPQPTSGLALANWVQLGPGNIGGRTRAIVVSPQQPATMWAGGAGGGVWRTDDGGGHWEPVDDFMASLAVTSLVMDPTDPCIIYAGTGEGGFANVDAVRGAGIFRTVDGTSWQQLPATATADFQQVNRLAISGDGAVLLAATPQGLFLSSDPQRTIWTRVLPASVADVKFNPTASAQAVAGGIHDGNAYFTTDGGQTWTPATHNGVWTGRVELAYAAHDPTIVYASIQMTTGEIWCSTDGGQTYARRNSATADGSAANYLGDQGWYGNVIWAGDPTDANFVIVGGINLWKSNDGGNTLIDISTWWDPRSAHADHHAIVAHPGYDGTTNKTVFFGNDGGIYKADDVTTVGDDPQQPRVSGWSELNNTYSVTQFYSAAGNPTTGTIIGGAQDNGTLCFTPAAGSERWTSIFGGDGGWCAADPTDPNVFYGEYVFLNIHRNMDGGATSDTQGDRYISGQFWNQARNEWDWKPIPFRIQDAMTQSALFIAPFVLDPNEPNRILAGGAALWRTNDAKTPNTNTSGPSWTSIKPSVGARISAIAVAQGNSDLIWVGHEDGSVYMTTNGTAANPLWQRMDGGAGPNPLSTGRYCARIVIDPHDSQNAFVTFGGYTPGNVWRTTDAGANWHDISGSLPSAPVRALAIHPNNALFLYLGTELGLFASEDGGATWSPTNEGPTNCSVDDLFWMNQTLVCATHGRGLFRIDLSGV